MNTRYTTSHACFDAVPDVVLSRLSPGMSVCEVGGGANPLLSRDERDRLNLTYTIVDIDAEELAKAPDDVRKLELDITLRSLHERFDLVVSKQVAEHVRHPEPMHRNICAMLAPGGVAIHFFPTLFSAPFVVNRIIPERLAARVLLRLQPYRSISGKHGKFRAYYRWCRGPTRGQVRRLRRSGFEIDEYVAGFGHTYYCRSPHLQRLEDAKTQLLLRHPVALLTSYAIVVLRRPV